MNKKEIKHGGWKADIQLEKDGVDILKNSEKIRQFKSGATRDTTENKLDYDGFFSPIVLQRFAQYMNKHRVQSDGGLRDADNLK